MARMRIKTSLILNNVVNAETVRTNLVSRIALLDKFSERTPERFIDENGRIIISFDLRLNRIAEANSLYADIVDSFSNGTLSSAILVGSIVNKHLCYHDEEPQHWKNCHDHADSSYVEDTK